VQRRFAEYALRVDMLSRFRSKKAQTDTAMALRAGSVDIVVGTHRLLSKDVHFKRLGLLIVDEEQRFGVAAKERIKQLKKDIDVLTLSATPIPRTLQLALGGLSDLSIIATPPLDRRAVRTTTARYDDSLVQSVIERELDRGGQVYYVYNRVEGIAERAARIQALVPRAKVVVGHGQLSEAVLERTMLSFVQGETNVLVATAIVESGLDIPRAVTLHLRDDTPLDTKKIARWAVERPETYRVTPHGQVVRRATERERSSSGLELARRMLREIAEG